MKIRYIDKVEGIALFDGGGEWWISRPPYEKIEIFRPNILLKLSKYQFEEETIDFGTDINNIDKLLDYMKDNFGAKK